MFLKSTIQPFSYVVEGKMKLGFELTVLLLRNSLTFTQKVIQWRELVQESDDVCVAGN
jgi:hypothetical protein